MDEQYPGIIGKTVLATGAFLAFGAGLAVLGAAAPLIAGGLGVVLALIGTIATPIGAVVVGIGALIAAAVLMRDELTQGFDLMLAGARDTWDAIKGLGAAVGDLVTSKLAALADWAAPRLMEVLDGLKRDWVAITENVTHLFRLMDDFTGGNLTRVFEGIRDMVDSLGKWTGDGLLRALEGVRDRVLAVFQPLRDLLDSLTSWLPGSEAAPGSTRERLGTMPPGFVPMGFTGGIPLGTGAAGITTIYVRAEPGTVVTRVEGGQAGVQVNPGPTTVRI